jgi:hypothetical protein
MAHRLGQLAGTLALPDGVVDCIGLDRLTHNFWSLANCYMFFIFHKSTTYLI